MYLGCTNEIVGGISEKWKILSVTFGWVILIAYKFLLQVFEIIKWKVVFGFV